MRNISEINSFEFSFAASFLRSCLRRSWFKQTLVKQTPTNATNLGARDAPHLALLRFAK